jgi:DNA mismatch endonuclease, patch repair protein
MINSGKLKKSKRPNPSKACSTSRSHVWSVGGAADNMAPEHRSHTMASVRGRDTAPEMVVRRIAHQLGFRFRLCRRDLPGCPDLVFPCLRCVIFVHGCFWHSHRCKKGRLRPVNNAALWRSKLEGNMARDLNAARKLKRDGWRVLTLWECQLRNLLKLTWRIKQFLGFLSTKKQESPCERHSVTSVPAPKRTNRAGTRHRGPAPARASLPRPGRRIVSGQGA